jgi:hypothetical protein
MGAAVHLSDFDQAVVGADPASQRLDQAQLLATTAGRGHGSGHIGCPEALAMTGWPRSIYTCSWPRSTSLRQAAAADVIIDATQNCAQLDRRRRREAAAAATILARSAGDGVLLLIVAVTLVSAGGHRH